MVLAHPHLSLVVAHHRLAVLAKFTAVLVIGNDNQSHQPREKMTNHDRTGNLKDLFVWEYKNPW